MQLSSSLRFSHPKSEEDILTQPLKIGGLFGGLPKTITASDDMYPSFFAEKYRITKNIMKDLDILRVLDTNLIAIGGQPVQEVYVPAPSLTQGVSRQLGHYGIRTFEDDLRHTRRLLLNKKFNMDYGNRWRFVDIETDDSRNDIDLGAYGSIKILSISISDGKKNDWFFWNDFPGGEKEMLQHFYTKCLNERIGAFYGWNVRFDVGHIEGRLKHFKLGLPYSFSYLDMMEKYKFEVKGLGSYSLKEVTAHEGMAEQKIHRTKKVSKMERDELEKYNRRDVDVLATLDEKYGFSMLYNQMAKDVNLPLELLSAGNIGDQLILERLRELGFVGINLIEREADKYTGAYVKTPPSGLFRDVGVYDFTALYPNIIIHNSIDILNFGGRVVPHILKTLLTKREEYKKMYEQTGDIKWDTMQKAIKPKVNALYGLFGYKYARFYDKHKAEFVTVSGRKIIQTLIKYAEQDLGGRVFYTDTDSVFLDLNSFGGAHMAKYVANVLNKRMHPFELKLEYVLDQMIFPKGDDDGNAPKKRYVGVYRKKDKKTGKEKEEWTIRGLEMRRGDWCMLAKTVQKKVAEMMFAGKDRYEIMDYLMEVKYDMFRGKYDEMLPISKSVKIAAPGEEQQNTPQFRAFKMLEDITKTKRFVNKVTYILVNTKEGVYPIDEDIPVEIKTTGLFPDGLVVKSTPKPDYKAYWERQILPPSMRLFEVLPKAKQQKIV